MLYEGKNENRDGIAATVYPLKNSMGGTDASDQAVSYYRPRVKTVAWPIRIFTHYINVSVVNAHIIFDETVGGMSQLEFRKVLIQELLINEIDEENEQIQSLSRFSKAVWKKELTRLDKSGHNPEIINIPESVDKIKEKKDHNTQRGRCFVCKKNLSIKCSKRNVFLHLNKVDGQMSCWERFHTVRDPFIVELSGM